jgi:hypothetical protein
MLAKSAALSPLCAKPGNFSRISQPRMSLSSVLDRLCLENIRLQSYVGEWAVGPMFRENARNWSCQNMNSFFTILAVVYTRCQRF